MWPFGRKNKQYGAGEEVQFLRDTGWYQFPNGAWGHDDHPGFLTFRQAMQHGQVEYETHQARERFRKQIHLFDPNTFVGRVISKFRSVFRMK